MNTSTDFLPCQFFCQNFLETLNRSFLSSMEPLDIFLTMKNKKCSTWQKIGCAFVCAGRSVCERKCVCECICVRALRGGEGGERERLLVSTHQRLDRLNDPSSFSHSDRLIIYFVSLSALSLTLTNKLPPTPIRESSWPQTERIQVILNQITSFDQQNPQKIFQHQIKKQWNWMVKQRTSQDFKSPSPAELLKLIPARQEPSKS